jgi:hypothetical protein
MCASYYTPNSEWRFSEEVGNFTLEILRFGRLAFNSVEDIELLLHFFVYVQDGSDISTSVAVVRCRPHCDKIVVFEPILKSVHDKLMSTSD